MRILFLLCLAVLFTGSVYAQDILVTGKVLSGENAAALPGASVKVKNSSQGTTTNEEGIFSLRVASTAVLEISNQGYASLEIAVSGKNDLGNIFLTVTDDVLERVVVVAYGTVKQGENTNSSIQITPEQLKNRPVTNIASSLEGMAPGIVSSSANGQPGSSPAIRLRGFGSISASSSPLFVVDGIIYNGGLSNFNPDDIESISVLKDASSAALYGSKGANGVVMITTKKGRAGRNNFNVKVTQGWVSRGIPEYDRVDAYEYYPLMWESLKNSLITAGDDEATARTKASRDIVTKLGYNPFNVIDEEVMGTNGELNPNAQLLYKDNDWFYFLQQPGHRQEYGISYSAGNERSDLFASVGFLDEKGYLINSDQLRMMGRINANTKLTNWLKTGLNIGATNTKSNQIRDAATSRIDNPFYFTRTIGPIYPVHAHDQYTGEFLLDAEGKRIYDNGSMPELGQPTRPSEAFPAKHIVQETMLNSNNYRRNAYSARAYAEITFIPGLNLRANLGADQSNEYSAYYGNKFIGNDQPYGGTLALTSYRDLSYTFNQLLTYDKAIDVHSFSVLLGHENESYTINYLSAERQGETFPGIRELSNFKTAIASSSGEDNLTRESYFGRIGYDFEKKYFFSGSLRYDGNSRFHPDVRWAPFYSVSAAWRLDKETFLQGAGWINELKLRSSYGVAGNDAGIGYYAYQALYALDFNNANETGIRQSSKGNPALTWESQKSTDVAVEFAFFNHRLRGSFELYHRNSDGLIFSVQLPLSQGGYFIPQNIGAMKNTGYEASLTYEVVRKEKFNWSVTANATTVKNEITRMPVGQEEIIDGTKKLKVGQSIYDYWLIEYMGVNPQTGQAQYRAADESAAGVYTVGKDVLTTNHNNGKFHYAGSAIPDLYGSFVNTIRYGNFELSSMLTFQLGGKIYDGTYASLMHTGQYGRAMHKDALNAWKQPGDITEVPALNNAAVTASTLSRWLTDASYLNLRNINLSYAVPAKWAEKAGAAGATVFLNGSNLVWITERKGMNPQQSYTGVTSNNAVPARIVSAGINVNF